MLSCRQSAETRRNLVTESNTATFTPGISRIYAHLTPRYLPFQFVPSVALPGEPDTLIRVSFKYIQR